MVNFAIQKISHKLTVSSHSIYPATSYYKSSCSDNEITIPEIYEQQKTTADLVIFIGYINQPTNYIDGYGKYCVQIGATGKPIMGKLILNIGRLKMDGSQFEKNINIATHEILHIMGFNSNLYSSFTKVDENPFSFIDTDKKLYVRGKNIIEKAKSHFNCPTIDKFPMEDESSSGSDKHHFEFRILGTDIMNGSAKKTSNFSYFTLAFLADSGW